MTDGDQANRDLEQHYATHKYSVIPDKAGGVHAVLDGIVRSVFHSGTYAAGLPALCGAQIHPANRLPDNAMLCPSCKVKVETFDGVLIPRPKPGNPLLKQMAALYPAVERG